MKIFCYKHCWNVDSSEKKQLRSLLGQKEEDCIREVYDEQRAQKYQQKEWEDQVFDIHRP